MQVQTQSRDASNKMNREDIVRSSKIERNDHILISHNNEEVEIAYSPRHRRRQDYKVDRAQLIMGENTMLSSSPPLSPGNHVHRSSVSSPRPNSRRNSLTNSIGQWEKSIPTIHIAASSTPADIDDKISFFFKKRNSTSCRQEDDDDEDFSCSSGGSWKSPKTVGGRKPSDNFSIGTPFSRFDIIDSCPNSPSTIIPGSIFLDSDKSRSKKKVLKVAAQKMNTVAADGNLLNHESSKTSFETRHKFNPPSKVYWRRISSSSS